MADYDYRLLDFEMLMQQQVDVVGQRALQRIRTKPTRHKLHGLLPRFRFARRREVERVPRVRSVRRRLSQG
jgi:hypothetical protein